MDHPVSHVEPSRNTKGLAPDTKDRGNQLYRWDFTLKASEPYEPEEPERLCTLLKDFCKEFYFQLEKGNETGYLHYQGIISLKTKHRKTETINLIGNNNVSLRPIRNWNAAKNYVKKGDTRVDGPWSHETVFIKTIKELRGWQKELTNIALSEPDDRSIYWIYETTGGVGKTAWAKYMCVKNNATVIGNGRKTDIAYAISNNPKTVIFSFTRSNEGHINYDAIESVKDGILFSAKYESKLKVFNCPHVFCISNMLPNIESMSMNRWKIGCIKNDNIEWLDPAKIKLLENITL